MLPSSLTEVRSFTWGEFPLPTCVGLRYGQSYIWLEAFLGGLGAGDFRRLAPARPSRHAQQSADLPTDHTPVWEPSLSIRWVHLPYRVPSSLDRDALRCRTIRPAFHRLRRAVLGLGPD
jgi:hypothetical protein